MMRDELNKYHGLQRDMFRKPFMYLKSFQRRPSEIFRSNFRFYRFQGMVKDEHGHQVFMGLIDDLDFKWDLYMNIHRIQQG